MDSDYKLKAKIYVKQADFYNTSLYDSVTDLTSSNVDDFGGNEEEVVYELTVTKVFNIKKREDFIVNELYTTPAKKSVKK